MASLGEISVDLKANTSQFDSAMKSSTGGMAKAAKGAAGLAAAAAAVGAAAVAASVAVFDMVKSVAAAGDAAAKAAARMGTTAEVVQELGHAAELSGASIVDVEKAFIRVGKNAQDAADGTSTAVDAFARLGVNVRDASGQLKTSEALFTDAAQAISEMENTTQQAAAAQEVFGKSGTKLLPMLKAGSAGIAEMRNEARELGIVLSNDAAATSERFNDTLDKLSKSFEGIKMQVGAALLPAFTELANIVLGVTKRFFEQVDVAKYMQQGLKFLTTQALSLIDTLIEFSPILAGVATAMRVASNMGQIWVEGLKIISKVVVGVSATVAEFVTGTLSGFIGGVSEVAEALGKDKLAASLRKAEQGIASVASTMGGVGEMAFDSLGDSVDNLATDFGDIDDAISDLASGAATSALRSTLGGIRDTIESVGTAQLDTAKKFESGADVMVKSARRVESALKDVALAAANAYLAEQGANRDARSKEVERIGSGMGAAVAEAEAGQKAHADGRSNAARDAELAKSGPDTAALAAPGIEELGKKSVVAGGALEAFSAGPIVGLIKVFTQLWSESEEMAKVFALLDGVLEPFRDFIDEIGKALMPVLRPIMAVFKALAPVIKAVLFVMNPFVIVLKIVGAAFKGIGKLLDIFAKPIKAVVVALRKFINGLRVFVHNLGRTRKSKKWDLDEEGNIVNRATGERVFGDKSPDREIEEANTSGNYAVADAADSAADSLNDLAEAVPAHIKRMSDQMVAAANAFTRAFAEPLATFGMGSGQVSIWSDLTDQLGRATNGLGDTADAAKEAAGAMLNMPEIFRADLRRAQSAGSGTPGGAMGGQSPAMGGTGSVGPGGVYIAGDVTVLGGDVDEFARNLQRQNYVRSGQTYRGMASMSGLGAAG